MKAMIGAATAVALGLLAAVPTASAQQSAQFCLRETSGALNCSYQTMAQCQSASNRGGGLCVENPSFGTTGSGGALRREGIPPQDGGVER
jgi:hypothetical protein